MSFNLLSEVFGFKSAELDTSIKLARDLADVVPGEEENLALHAEICARRFSALVELMVAGYNQSRANKLLILSTIALLLITNAVSLEQIATLVKTLL